MNEIIEGEIIEVGDMDSGGAGFVLAFRSEQVGTMQIDGLSPKSVAAIGRMLYRKVVVRVTVEPIDSEDGQALLQEIES